MDNNPNYVKGILEGDRVILQDIYNEYFPRIANYILSNNGSESDARDIFQEAMLIIYMKVSKPGFELSSKFYTFLYAICNRLWLKHLRKKRNEAVRNKDSVEYNSTEDSYDLEKIILKMEREEFYRKKFEALDTICKKLLEMYFEKAPMDEIAKKMGYTVKFATQKAFRCRKKLIELIKSDPAGGELTT